MPRSRSPTRPATGTPPGTEQATPGGPWQNASRPDVALGDRLPVQDQVDREVQQGVDAELAPGLCSDRDLNARPASLAPPVGDLHHDPLDSKQGTSTRKRWACFTLQASGNRGEPAVGPGEESLDGEIQSLTNGWWKRFLNEKGFQAKSDSKLYPLVPTRTPSNNKATIARVTRLNLRSGPGSEHEVLAQGRTGDEFQIIGRQDLWVQLRLPDGREAWAHRYYLTQVYDPSVGSAGLVNSLASSGN